MTEIRDEVLTRCVAELIVEAERIDEFDYTSEELKGLVLDLASHVKRLQIERDYNASRAQIAEAKVLEMVGDIQGLKC